MTNPDAPVVLGSRSPRRQQLLSALVGEDRVIVRPPGDASEPSLHEVNNADALAERLRLIASQKNASVLRQLQTDGSLPAVAAIVTADTVIVGTSDNGRLVVLGQPPATGDWQSTVRDWFRQYYFGRQHQAKTAICMTTPSGQRRERLVTTRVQFRDDVEGWLEWYLATGEPIGKAGGYGLQGAGSLFVERIEGSPSNVIGLPLLETAEMLHELGVVVAR